MVRQRAFARRALEVCARHCGIGNQKWAKDKNDVPQPCSGYHWSISHKPRWAAAVIADRPIGIDIEHIKPRRVELFDEVAGCQEWLLVGGRSQTAFFRIWTAKEAVLKANGVGIAKLLDCRVLAANSADKLRLAYADRVWQVEHFFHQDHLTAVTTDGDELTWHIELGGPWL
ncbi:MAG: 4'-phosphopantetheinyl transferase superfamily protein [Phycisphaerae bacterium]|nr:4'-phosphopantetheinyl transferase superfamily protein [Phycisphaerae bacterium]